MYLNKCSSVPPPQGEARVDKSMAAFLFLRAIIITVLLNVMCSMLPQADWSAYVHWQLALIRVSMTPQREWILISSVNKLFVSLSLQHRRTQPFY